MSQQPATPPLPDVPAGLALYKSQVEVNAAARQSIADQVLAQVRALIESFTSWYDDLAVRKLAKDITGVVQSGQRVMAAHEDAYMSAVLSAQAGQTVKPVGQVVVDDLRNGVDPVQVYERLGEQFRYSRSIGGDADQALRATLTRASVMTETDVTLAARAQDQKNLEATHLAVAYRRVIHPELAKGGSCGMCIAASDRVYRKGDLLPIHARCVPPNALVASNEVVALTRREYSGQFVVLACASGDTLTVTPNHPVLTRKGWVPAGLVEGGYELIKNRNGHGAVQRGPQKNNVPTTVEQVWRAATVDIGLNSSRVPLSTEDFYGDGSDGEVDVVSPGGLLSDVGNVSFVEPLHESPLVSGRFRGSGFTGESGSLQSALGLGYATGGGVSGGSHHSTLCPRHAAIADGLGFGYAPDLNPRFTQSAFNGVSRNGVFLGEGQHGSSGLVGLDDLVIGQRATHAPRFDPAGFEFSSYGAGAYAELGTRLLDGLSSEVGLDCVVEKRWVSGSHYVYDLSTRGGWFVSDSYIVSNCNCTIAPIMRGGSDPGNSLNNLSLSDLYDHAGGTQAVDLKRTRYKIEDHSELGPQLVPAHLPKSKYLARTSDAGLAQKIKDLGDKPPSKFQTDQLTRLQAEQKRRARAAKRATRP